MWRVTNHAIDTKAGFVRIARPDQMPMAVWYALAVPICAILNR